MIKVAIFDKFENLPAPRNVAAAITTKEYDEAIKKSGKITAYAILAAGVVSYKTLRKHMMDGTLPAEKNIVYGKDVWLIDPDEARIYLENLADTMEAAVRHKKNRPTRVTAPEGYVTLTDAAKQCDISHWTLRDHLDRTGIKTFQGKHAAKMIATGDVAELQRYFEDIVRPKSRRSERREPKKGRVAGGLYFESFSQIWSLMRSQPETDFGELMYATGAVKSTVDRWKNQSREPSSLYHGAIIALFRMRYPCRLSENLQGLAKEHRREYMRDYMEKTRGRSVTENGKEI